MIVSRDADDEDLVTESLKLMMPKTRLVEMMMRMMMVKTWPVERSSALRLRKMTGE